MEISSGKWESQRKLGLDLGFRDATADYLRRRWPTHTAKNAARTFNLTHDRAREAVAGRISLTSLEQMFKVGGFAVALPIVAAVIGQSIAAYLRQQMAQAAKAAEHAEQHERLAAAAYRALEDHPAGPGADRRQGRGPGAVGAEAPVRMAGSS